MTMSAQQSSIDHCRITGELDLVMVRALLRNYSLAAGLSVLDMTKLITAGSELARNIIKYADGCDGQMKIDEVSSGHRRGVRATFIDTGPGIPNLDKAMQDGFSTGGSMGIGLPGAKRLSDEFSIESKPGQTVVTIIKWKR